MGLPPEAIVNEAGQVAMRYGRQAPTHIKCGDRSYIFSVQANISLAWVEPEDIPCMLAKRDTSGCCGSSRRGPVISFCDETHLRRWTNRGGN